MRTCKQTTRAFGCQWEQRVDQLERGKGTGLKEQREARQLRSRDY